MLLMYSIPFHNCGQLCFIFNLQELFLAFILVCMPCYISFDTTQQKITDAQSNDFGLLLCIF